MSLFSTEDVVEALYRGVLDRRSDPIGFAHWMSILQAQPERLQEVASSFFHSEEHQKMCAGSGIDDHSQFGEYKILLKHFVEQGARRGVIVDVGARGRNGSNSFDLLQTHGWRGLLVEANPTLWDPIEKEFSGLSFELARCAVSDSAGTLPFYLGVNDDVSSLDIGHAETWGPLRGVVEVDVRKLGDILIERQIPLDFDVLSLDIEGLDVRVLNNLIEESDYRPAVVIVETSMAFFNTTLDDVPFSDLVRSLYKLSYQTMPNMILTLVS